MAKDLFSDQSAAYARYRPTYPPELYDYLLQFVPDRTCAWDCATGNGQAARVLAEYFTTVEATDISAAQLEKAEKRPNIHYQMAPAERTPFADNSFDLITVATAYHWLNWKDFREEAVRVAKNKAVIAAWAYNTFSSDDEKMAQLIRHFYNDIVYTYWDQERRHVENAYRSVEFDFDPLPARDFQYRLTWTREQFTGYLDSWSAVQHYTRAHQRSPVELIRPLLEEVWPEGTRTFLFPIFLRIGRIEK